MLNWRRDPGYEQRKMQHELRMKQLENEIEQLRRENVRAKSLSALIKQHCFPDDFNSTPLPPSEPDSSSS
jgi:cell shape-determining protein MreC